MKSRTQLEIGARHSLVLELEWTKTPQGLDVAPSKENYSALAQTKTGAANLKIASAESRGIEPERSKIIGCLTEWSLERLRDKSSNTRTMLGRNAGGKPTPGAREKREQWAQHRRQLDWGTPDAEDKLSDELSWARLRIESDEDNSHCYRTEQRTKEWTWDGLHPVTTKIRTAHTWTDKLNLRTAKMD
jgi:hypothetical protein